MTVTEHHFSGIVDAGRVLAGQIAQLLAAAIAERGRAAAAVSGGRTPRHIFPPLAEAPLDWRQVWLTLTDDRWVGPDSPDSNARLVRESLLNGNAAEAHFIPLISDAPTPEEGRATAQRRLQELDLPFDLVMLGMGEDGHIASLFPGTDWHAFTDPAPVVAAHPADLRPRLSLAPGCLLNTRQITLILSGKAKRETYAKARMPGSAAELPVRLILHQTKVPVAVYIAAT